MINTILMFVIAYLLGSIPSGVWIGKIFFNEDVREHGSGNSGTTNTFRVLGKKAGTAVLVMDILKGTVATLLPMLFDSNINPILVGVAAVVGHTFPIFAKFKGGKAVATSAGILLGYHPLFFCIAVVIFLTLLYLTRMVSVASMLGITLVFILSFIFNDWILSTVAGVLMVFVILRHRANIKRILNGTENKVPFGLGYKSNK